MGVEGWEVVGRGMEVGVEGWEVMGSGGARGMGIGSRGL